MRNKYLRLVAALLTFCIGITAASVLANYNSVDKRLAESLRKVYLKNLRENAAKISVAPENSEFNFDRLEKLLKENPPKITDKDLARIKADLKRLKEKSLRISASVKPPKEYSKDNIDERITEDLKNVNENCRINSFSGKQCDQLKEDSIKDIEENMLNQ